MRRLLGGLIAAALLTGGTALPVEAATKVLRDPGTQLSAANDLQRARLTYRPAKTVYRMKLKNLSRKHTQTIVRFYRPGYDLMITTKFVRGKKRVIARHTDYDTNNVTRFFKGVRVRWHFRDDVIRVVNTRFLSGRSARMEAYTVPKGAMHGPYGEPNDYMSTTVHRG